jgi:short-chain fatty acids transporter
MAEKVEKALKRTMGDKFVDWCYRWVPSALVLVFLLTILVCILCIIFVQSPIIVSTDTKKSLMDAWTGGFWTLLTFAMQMSLVMLTGYVLASAPLVKRGLKKIAQIPQSTLSAMLLCGIVTAVLFWIHWGLGMMASIVLARLVAAEARKKGYRIHLPALVAYIYAEELCFVGISQAAPLYGSTKGYLQGLVTNDAVRNLIPSIISLKETVVNPLILGQCICLFIMVTLVSFALMPKDKGKLDGNSRIEEMDMAFADEILAEEEPSKVEKNIPSERMNNSRVLSYIIGIFGLIWCIKLIATNGIVGISLNNYNFIMLIVGILVCGTPNVFCKCVVEAITSVWGVIIQFPFYAGIFGLITQTGLNEVIVNFFMSISNHDTWPVVAYIYSALLNLIVPSGGSKFIIEAPYILQVCTNLDVPVSRIIDAYTFGDLSTNPIQPFWALPFMAMFKMDFKQILPYTAFCTLGAVIINILYIGFLY